MASCRTALTPSWERQLGATFYRLEEQGWISAEWGVSDNNRKARYYKLTAAGRKQLAAELQNWARVSAAINLVLENA